MLYNFYFKFIHNNVLSHLPMCKLSLYIVPFLPTADACHTNKDLADLYQVDKS